MPFDPADGAGFPDLDALLRGPSAALTAVALVAGIEARASGWAAATAVALARRWPGPRRAILADLDLERPTLHELAGVSNDEGLVDVVAYGISLHRAAVPWPDAGFELLPAGILVGGADEVLRAAPWQRLLREVAARRETLLLYLPGEAAAAATIVEVAGAVLVLGGSDTASLRLPHPFAVLSVLAPPVARAPAAVPVETTRLSDEEFERIRLPTDAGAREALIADLRSRQRAARLQAATETELAAVPTAPEAVVPEPIPVVPVSGDVARELRVEAAADDVALETIDPTKPRAPVRRKRFRHPIGWTIAVVLVLSLVAGTWHFLARRRAAVAADTTPPPPPVQPPAATRPDIGLAPPGADAVPYSVAMEAHQNLATAFERVDALSAAQQDMTFFIAPLERDGVLYYHVMAGPLADSSAALAVRDTLLTRRLKRAATPTDIRHAPLALLIGDYSTREGAAEQLTELRNLDIPAYVLNGVAADGAPLYRIFVGAFAGPAEAEVIRQLLRAAGIRDTLVNRTRSSTP